MKYHSMAKMDAKAERTTNDGKKKLNLFFPLPLSPAFATFIVRRQGHKS
ncbi:MAG: hypothetical protein ABI091_05975 [Ferruginibacter sp.]